MTKVINLQELRINLDTYLADLTRDKSFIVVRRSKPIFKITLPDEDENERFDRFAEAIKTEIKTQYKDKKIPSLRDQFSNL